MAKYGPKAQKLVKKAVKKHKKCTLKKRGGAKCKC